MRREKVAEAALEKMKNEMPRTHSYFRFLEENRWCSINVSEYLSLAHMR